MHMSHCYPLGISLAFFWGHNSPVALQQGLLVAACAFDLSSYYLRGLIFVVDTAPARAFSISEVLAYHQREMRALGLWPKMRTSTRTSNDHVRTSNDHVGNTEIKVWMNRLPVRVRHRTQQALWAYTLVVFLLWFTLMVVRQMWGFHIIGFFVGISFLSLLAFPLPEDPARRQIGAMMGHYASAFGVFVGFGGLLIGGHGICDLAWPLLPFSLCTATAAIGGLLLHSNTSPPERYSAWQAGVHCIGCCAEWAALSIFYVAIMWPPGYSEQ